jgi:endonuclease-3
MLSAFCRYYVFSGYTVFMKGWTMSKAPTRKRLSRLSKAQIVEMFTRLQAQMPTPETELQWTNPYTLTVAVALSAQATDVGVNKATKKLFEIVKTPDDMLALGEDGLKEHIKTIGLYNSKAKNVMKAAEILVNTYNSKVPETREELEKLPGVGRKTANVVLNVAFGQPTIAVDTHIFRVGNRTGLAPGATPLAVELILEKVIPAEFLLHAHHWLILHGRYVCKARKPVCMECKLFDVCKFKDKTVDA